MGATGVLVVGEGPAGLTMANILNRQGVGYRIIDKKAGRSKRAGRSWSEPRPLGC